MGRGADGGKFKSPIKIIVSPLVKLFIQVDKKKVNKIAEGKLQADNAGSLIKGGWFQDMDDDAAGAIALVLSLVILCICLFFIVKFLRALVMGSAKKWIMKALSCTETWWGGYIAIIVGMGATIAVQSSSITTSTLTPLVGVGVITLQQMLPLTLGANIGTTCTGLLAALVSGKVNGLQIAICHLFFNIFGILVWYPVPWMRQWPLLMAKKLGLMAWLFKWFPPVYIAIFFFIFPLIFLGISNLFEAGAVGIVFGVIVLLIIVGAGAGAFYWYKYKDGKQWLINNLISDEKLAALEVKQERERRQEEAAQEASIHTGTDK